MASSITEEGKISTPIDNEENKKRKLDDSENDSQAEKKSKGFGISKLAAFAFNKES